MREIIDRELVSVFLSLVVSCVCVTPTPDDQHPVEAKKFVCVSIARVHMHIELAQSAVQCKNTTDYYIKVIFGFRFDY